MFKWINVVIPIQTMLIFFYDIFKWKFREKCIHECRRSVKLWIFMIGKIGRWQKELVVYYFEDDLPIRKQAS